MFGALDTSTSALVANRQWLDTISNNMANQHSIVDADGNYAPYQRRVVLFAEGNPAVGGNTGTDSNTGVHIADIIHDNSFRKVYEPGHPGADADGYVNYPDINPVTEMANALVASRAYEANITAIEATKSMMNHALRLIA